MDKNPEAYQWLILFLLQAVAIMLLSQLNQSLTTVSLFLFINGLFITFPGLFLPLGQGVAVVVLLSIFYDSGESWKLGTSLIPNLALFAFVYYLRNRIRYDRRSVIKHIILLVNSVLFFYYTVLAGIRWEVTSPFVFLNLVHLLVSQLVLLAVSGGLITFQKDVLRMFRIDIRTSLRGTK